MEIIPVTPLLLNSFENYILPSVMNDLREDQENHFAFGLVQNTHSCGAAAGYFYGDRFRIRSFYVDEAIRRQGAGSLLLNGVVSALTGYAEQIDINYVLNDSLRAEMESFLDTHGFSAPALVSKIYVIRLGDVQNTRFFRGGSPLDAQRIFPLYHLPDSMLEPLATSNQLLLQSQAARSPAQTGSVPASAPEQALAARRLYSRCGFPPARRPP